MATAGMPLAAILALALAGGAAAGADEPVRIGRIDIEVVEVFDLSKPGEDRWFHRAVNSLHIASRDSVIRRELLFREGDVLNADLLAESERNLRALPFLRAAEVTAGEPAGGVADVRVRVQDSWTTRASARIKRAGGHTSAAFSAREENLAGLGKQLGFRYESDQDRSRGTFSYDDRRLLGRPLWLQLAHQVSSDGEGDLISIQKPFYSYGSRSSEGASFSRNLQRNGIYSSGEKIASFDNSVRMSKIFLAFSRGLENGVASRFMFGWQYNASRFYEGVIEEAANDEGAWLTGGDVVEEGRCYVRSPDEVNSKNPRPCPAALVPLSRKTSSPLFGYRRERSGWIKAFNLVRMERPEDFNLGAVFELQAGVNAHAFGGEADELLLVVGGSRGFRIGAHGLLLTRQGFDARFGSGDAAAKLLSFESTYYNTRFRGQTLVGHLRADAGMHLDLANQLLLGGDEGLRGFNTRVLDGDRRFIATFEDRLWTRREVLHLFYIGGAAFMDVGNAWGWEDDNAFGTLYSDAGIGLRLDASRAAHGGMFRLDIAFPLSGDRRGGPAVQFSFSHGSGY